MAVKTRIQYKNKTNRTFPFLKGKYFLIILLLILILSFVLIKINMSEDVQKQLEGRYNEIPQGLGVSIHKGVTESDIQAIADAGFKWVRIDIFWSDVEKKKGQYDFKSSGYDQLNEMLKEKEIKPYYILAYENTIYEKNRSISTNAGREAFSKFVEATVKRYSNQNGVWEIWNEPNTETFWNNQPSHHEYALLVKKVAPVIRENDPNSIIVAPALAGVSEEALTWLRKGLDEHILSYIDAVSVHPYQYDNPETVTKRYENLRSLLKEYSKKDIPIISGEWGYSLVNSDKQKPINEMQQAEYIARMMLINSSEKIPISIWYDWKDDGQDSDNREHHFGINSYYGTPKLAYLSIQTLTKTLEEYRFSKRIKTENPNDYILEFLKNDKDKIIVYWTTGSSHFIKVPLDSGEGKLVSMLGAERQVKWGNKKGLNLLTSPTYLIIE